MKENKDHKNENIGTNENESKKPSYLYDHFNCMRGIMMDSIVIVIHTVILVLLLQHIFSGIIYRPGFKLILTIIYLILGFTDFNAIYEFQNPYVPDTYNLGAIFKITIMPFVLWIAIVFFNKSTNNFLFFALYIVLLGIIFSQYRMRYKIWRLVNETVGDTRDETAQIVKGLLDDGKGTEYIDKILKNQFAYVSMRGHYKYHKGDEEDLKKCEEGIKEITKITEA